MKLFPSLYANTIVFIALSITANAQNNFQPLWETSLNHYDKKHASLTAMVSPGDEKKVAVLNPMAIEIYDSSIGSLIAESPCVRSEQKFKGFKPTGFGPSNSKGIEIGAGKKKEKLSVTEELDALQKIVHVPLPHRNAVLRFDYGVQREVFSLIDLSNGKTLWTNSELQWGMDRAKDLLSSLASLTPGPKARAALGVDMLQYPAYYIESLIQIIPERDELLVDSFLGLACIDLTTGETKWEVPQTAKGLSYILFDKESNSLLTFGGNPAWLPTLPGMANLYQLNKDILRIDINTGDIIWQSSFNKNFRVKKDGGFNSELVKPDIRLVNNRIITNFNQIEVFDFKTGLPLMETSNGQDAKMGFMSYGPASEFALPLIEGDVIYRSVITDVLAFGASAGGEQANNFKAVLEAYNMGTGELLWTTKEFTRQKINNMAMHNGLLIISFDGNEGVKALNPESGETVWAFETSKKGIETKWLVVGNSLIVAEKKEIHVLDQKSGNVIYTLNTGKNAGSISELKLYKNNLLVLGDKNGMDWYNLETGTLITGVKTGFTSEFLEYPDKIIVFPKAPSDPMLILDPNNLNVLCQVKKSGTRSALSWCESSSNVYSVEGKKVKAQQFSGIKN